MNPTWGYPTKPTQDIYGGASYEMLPDWAPSRPITAADVTGANGLLDLSPTSRAWESLWGSTVDNPAGTYSPEAARARFGSDPRAFAGGLINLGLTEGNASKIPQTLTNAGYSPEYAAQVEQMVKEINSRQHNESSGFDLGPLLAMGGIGLALGGFPAFGAFGGLSDSAAMAGLEGTGGMWGAAAPSSLSFTGSVPNWNWGSTGMANLEGTGGMWGAPTTEAAGGWGVNAATGGGMDLSEFMSNYNPNDPFGFAGDAASNYGSISEPLTGTGFPSSSNSFAGYDFGLGYPVGGNMVTNLAGGGLIPAFADPSLLTELAKKVGPDAAKSVFQKWLANPTDTSAIGNLLGAAAPGLISEFFKNQQANTLSGSLTDIANQARADRSPFLDYAKSTLAGGPGAYATTGPGGESLKAVLHKLSAGFGNPVGSPAALGIATDSANRTWGDDWRQAANIGLGGNYSQLATNAATAGAGTSGAGFGDAAASVFAPQNSLEQLLKQLKAAGLGGDIFSVGA